MAYVIAEPCIDQMDQSCVAVCPVDCISADPSVDRKFYIDPDGCIDCGSCETACPNQAIYRQDMLPAEYEGYAWVDAMYHRDPDAARDGIEQILSAIAS